MTKDLTEFRISGTTCKANAPRGQPPVVRCYSLTELLYLSGGLRSGRTSLATGGGAHSKAERAYLWPEMLELRL